MWTVHSALCEGGSFKPGSIEDRRFLALAMCGEAGEVANLIKKQWRGDNIPNFEALLEEEIGDTFAYLYLLTIAYGMRSPSRILEEVILPKIKKRWPDHFEPRE
jgi:NTP pyrophosphatase (non-canonical NTP hydrolase)